jgi:hypothetical protein
MNEPRTFLRGRVELHAKDCNENDLMQGRIIEGSSTLQCACPVCNYGEGYCESFLSTDPQLVTLTCKTCGVKFVGLIS